MRAVRLDGEHVNPKKKRVKIPVLEQGFRVENGDIKFI